MDIRPILAASCLACHGPDENQRKAKLRLDRRDDAIKAGVLVPGKPDESELITRVFSDLTVLENLTLALHGLSRTKLSLLRPWRSYRSVTAEAAEFAAKFGLAGRLGAIASELSHGEVRELEVLLALALKPRVLLLDEPAAGRSPAERVDIQALLRSLPPELTLVMVEHDMDVLRGVVDSAAVLHLGALVVQGPMREIQNDDRVRELYLGRAGAGRRSARGLRAPGPPGLPPGTPVEGGGGP